VTTPQPKLVRWCTAELIDPVIGTPQRPLSGSTQTQTMNVFEGNGGKASAGVWQATAGTFRSDTTGYIEFCHIVEGSCRVVDPDGTVHALKAGDPFVMPEGYKGHWEVDEFVKKVYFVAVTG
jgi:uncharacterized protein